MREIEAEDISRAVAGLCVSANQELPPDVLAALEKARTEETSSLAQDILDQLVANARLARDESLPICQDTGVAVIFVELGQEVHLSGDLYQALDEGVRRGYEEGYLRKSLCHPFSRKNSGDNTPAVVHLKLVKGDQVKLILAAKGGGSENMSQLFMLKPADGWEGVKARIIETVVQAGPNPCPPTIVGVGLGGNFERAAILAKEALLRPLNQPNPDPDLAAKEAEVLEAINQTGLGPQALGGRTFCLGVHILTQPCHIASLPLAINLQCHAARHKEIIL